MDPRGAMMSKQSETGIRLNESGTESPRCRRLCPQASEQRSLPPGLRRLCWEPPWWSESISVVSETRACSASNGDRGPGALLAGLQGAPTGGDLGVAGPHLQRGSTPTWGHRCLLDPPPWPPLLCNSGSWQYWSVTGTFKPTPPVSTEPLPPPCLTVVQ